MQRQGCRVATNSPAAKCFCVNNHQRCNSVAFPAAVISDDTRNSIPLVNLDTIFVHVFRLIHRISTITQLAKCILALFNTGSPKHRPFIYICGLNSSTQRPRGIIEEVISFSNKISIRLSMEQRIRLKSLGSGTQNKCRKSAHVSQKLNNRRVVNIMYAEQRITGNPLKFRFF